MKTFLSRPRWWRRWWRPLGLVVAVGLAGCDLTNCSTCWQKGDCPRLEKGAIPELTGTHTKRVNEMQEFLAEADDLTIYEHEWLLGGSTLGPFGMFHLGQMLPKLDHLPFPVVIEYSPDDHLNAQRRHAIINYLVTNSVPPAEAERRVIVAYPLTEGLYGDEAAIAFDLGFRSGVPYGSAAGPYTGPNGINGTASRGLGGRFGGIGGFGGFGGFGAFGLR